MNSSLKNGLFLTHILIPSTFPAGMQAHGGPFLGPLLVSASAPDTEITRGFLAATEGILGQNDTFRPTIKAERSTRRGSDTQTKSVVSSPPRVGSRCPGGWALSSARYSSMAWEKSSRRVLRACRLDSFSVSPIDCEFPIVRGLLPSTRALRVPPRAATAGAFDRQGICSSAATNGTLRGPRARPRPAPPGRAPPSRRQNPAPRRGGAFTRRSRPPPRPRAGGAWTRAS